MRITACVPSVLALLALGACASAGGGRPAAPASDAKIALEAGKQYAQSGLYDQAIAKFKEAVAADPEFALAHMNLGVCYIQKGKDYYASARESLEKAASLASGRNDPLVWYNLTVIYTLTGVFDKAFDSLDRSLGNGFKNFDALRVDKDLNELRRKPEFRQILERHNVFL